MNRRTTLALLVAGLALQPASANILVNGSFEIWSGGYTPSNQPDRIFNDLTLAVPGWQFAIGLSSDIYRDRNATGAQSAYYSAAHGDYLAGAGSFGTLHEGVSQTFAALPNTLYQVSFQMAPGGLNYSGAWIEHATIGSSWRVDVTGAVPSPVSNSYNTNLAHFSASATTNPLAWTTQSFQFTSDAVGGNVTLQFTAYGDMTHVFLDNVVVDAVPAPATLASLCLMGALGHRRRRGWARD
ncbi:MAG: hypothetical protein JNM80_08880 [Phycisphaerae bacterium]|nr:hypothetical protein [Phycisphaerae bacterium]